jgi:hypothetical protein
MSVDDDEIDNSFRDVEETYDDATTKKLELKMEEERKKQHYYDRLVCY